MPFMSVNLPPDVRDEILRRGGNEIGAEEIAAKLICNSIWEESGDENAWRLLLGACGLATALVLFGAAVCLVVVGMEAVENPERLIANYLRFGEVMIDQALRGCQLW